MTIFQPLFHTLRPTRRVLVNSAGTNAPRRALEVLSLEDYHAMMNTNLNGAYYCAQAFLPQLRTLGFQNVEVIDVDETVVTDEPVAEAEEPVAEAVEGEHEG